MDPANAILIENKIQTRINSFFIVTPFKKVLITHYRILTHNNYYFKVSLNNRDIEGKFTKHYRYCAN